jgi:N-acetylglucosamine-6-phosphate deacetylase
MKIIDIHAHGIGGYDTRTAAEEHILKIAEINGSYGVSEIMPAIYPAARYVMRENMLAVRKAMELQDAGYRMQDTIKTIPHPPLLKGGKGGLQNHASGIVHQASELGFPKAKHSKIIGVHLEGPFLNPEKCGALNAAEFIEPTEYNFKELIEGFEEIVKIITIAPEIKGAAGLIKKMSDMGVLVSMGHSNATYAEAEAGFNAGAKGITHIFNAMSGFHHREPGLAGFGLLNQDIYIEVIADPYHLHLKTFDLIFKTKNHDRIIIVSDTVKETKTSPSPLSPPFKGGGWEREQGITDIYGKLSGGCMTITEASKRLIEIGYNQDDIMAFITRNPERYLLKE